MSKQKTNVIPTTENTTTENTTTENTTNTTATELSNSIANKDMTVEFKKTTVGAWLKTKTALSICQRSEVYAADFAAGLKKTALAHWYIAPLTVLVTTLPDGKKLYIILDGQQRTAALAKARLTVSVADLERFDNCPLWLSIVALPEGLSEGEFFAYMNRNNQPSKGQAVFGLYHTDIQDLIHAVSTPELVKALYAKKTKADGIEVGNVTKYDDLVQGLALAVIAPAETSTSFGNVSKLLLSYEAGLSDKEKSIEIANNATAIVSSALSTIAKDEAMTKIYRRICNPKVLVPLYIAASGAKSASTLIMAIKKLFNSDGKAMAVNDITDFRLSANTTAGMTINWVNLIDIERGNDASSNYKRSAFIRRAYNQAAAERKVAKDIEKNTNSASGLPLDM